MSSNEEGYYNLNIGTLPTELVFSILAFKTFCKLTSFTMFSNKQTSFIHSFFLSVCVSLCVRNKLMYLTRSG